VYVLKETKTRKSPDVDLIAKYTTDTIASFEALVGNHSGVYKLSELL